MGFFFKEMRDLTAWPQFSYWGRAPRWIWLQTMECTVQTVPSAMEARSGASHRCLFRKKGKKTSKENGGLCWKSGCKGYCGPIGRIDSCTPCKSSPDTVTKAALQTSSRARRGVEISWCHVPDVGNGISFCCAPPPSTLVLFPRITGKVERRGGGPNTVKWFVIVEGEHRRS